VLAQPRQHRPGLVRRGEFVSHVLAEGLEGFALRASQRDPAQAAQPVLGK
jgi:hypothetical protein